MSKPGSCAEAALDELCAKYGYCLPSEKAEELLTNSPDNADAFVDAVLIAEGIDPSLVDKHARRQLREVVSGWLFDDGRGRGTKSGLPQFPSGT
jgi:hypothetical protein